MIHHRSGDSQAWSTAIDSRFHDQVWQKSTFSKLKAFYYPKTNIIPSENTQVVNGDRLKIDSRRRSQVRLLLLAFLSRVICMPAFATHQI
jgi:hypothetical protein